MFVFDFECRVANGHVVEETLVPDTDRSAWLQMRGIEDTLGLTLGHGGFSRGQALLTLGSGVRAMAVRETVTPGEGVER